MNRERTGIFLDGTYEFVHLTQGYSPFVLSSVDFYQRTREVTVYPVLLSARIMVNQLSRQHLTLHNLTVSLA